MNGEILCRYPPREILRKNCYEILPPEGAESSFLHIPVAGAAPIFRAFASTVDVFPTKSRIESAECFTDFLRLARLRYFEINESAAGGRAHLPFSLLDEKGLACSHKSGSSLNGDSFDVASDESVVGCGSNDGFHV